MQGAPPALRRARFRSKVLRRPVVRLRHRGLNDHDSFLASYPRSGSTWLRFLLFETLAGESAQFGHMRRAVPSVGKHHDAIPVLKDGGRVIQTHETFSDGNRRVIYVVRDARSVVVSEYSWQRRLGIETGDFDGFLEKFLKGRSNPWGSWGNHVEFWLTSESARDGRLLMVKFEDLRRDTERTFRKILDFLDASAGDDTVRRAIENNSLHNMRAKEDEARRQGWRPRARSDIRFINTGAVTGWREKLSREQATLIEREFGTTLAKLGYL